MEVQRALRAFQDRHTQSGVVSVQRKSTAQDPGTASDHSRTVTIACVSVTIELARTRTTVSRTRYVFGACFASVYQSIIRAVSGYTRTE